MERKRGFLLTIFAVLFAIAAIQDALKPFHLEGPTTGLVVLGTRLSGTPQIMMSIVLAAFLLAYSFGIWQMYRYALTLAFIYAVYVSINLAVFPFKYAGQDNGPIWFLIAFTIFAIAIPWGSAVLLWRHRGELV